MKKIGRAGKELMVVHEFVDTCFIYSVSDLLRQMLHSQVLDYTVREDELPCAVLVFIRDLEQNFLF